ncbi:hypothetical protein BDK51DRAFT_47726 [Blyttiomyces helicus]|uniref:Uncharacterized protein n=1 Tax=Blyttiomyces helicus TaxID=388810 RepID=A0A4P9W6D8_9FUNG|nr:hypothetical protein BDK51DRAFT_47726 [Blyttiomyces helicus]|eukprot:RKO85686.1 hypothetical protein BDK51DRAFT_47726 [Blyttiomyces helicus]
MVDQPRMARGRSAGFGEKPVTRISPCSCRSRRVPRPTYHSAGHSASEYRNGAGEIGDGPVAGSSVGAKEEAGAHFNFWSSRLKNVEGTLQSEVSTTLDPASLLPAGERMARNAVYAIFMMDWRTGKSEAPVDPGWGGDGSAVDRGCGGGHPADDLGYHVDLPSNDPGEDVCGDVSDAQRLEQVSRPIVVPPFPEVFSSSTFSM